MDLGDTLPPPPTSSPPLPLRLALPAEPSDVLPSMWRSDGGRQRHHHHHHQEQERRQGGGASSSCSWSSLGASAMPPPPSLPQSPSSHRNHLAATATRTRERLDRPIGSPTGDHHRAAAASADGCSSEETDEATDSDDDDDDDDDDYDDDDGEGDDEERGDAGVSRFDDALLSQALEAEFRETHAIHPWLLTFADADVEARYVDHCYIKSDFVGGKLWFFAGYGIALTFYVYYYGLRIGWDAGMFVSPAWIPFTINSAMAPLMVASLFVSRLAPYREQLYLLGLLVHWPAFTIASFYGMAAVWRYRFNFVLGCLFFCTFVAQARFARVAPFITLSPLLTLALSTTLMSDYWETPGRAYAEVMLWLTFAAPIVILVPFERISRRRFCEMERAILLIEAITHRLFRTEDLISCFFAKTPTADFLSHTALDLRPRLYRDCVVIYTDLVQFTRWASGRPAASVTAQIASMYDQMDRLAPDLGVEKIVTVGDAFVGAIFGSHMTQLGWRCANACVFATKVLPLAHPLEMRVGVASGNVVVAFVGSQPPRFDLFGETPELAQRLEQASKPGHVNATSVVISHASLWGCPHEPSYEDGTVLFSVFDTLERSVAGSEVSCEVRPFGQMLSGVDELSLQPEGAAAPATVAVGGGATSSSTDPHSRSAQRLQARVAASADNVLFSSAQIFNISNALCNISTAQHDYQRRRARMQAMEKTENEVSVDTVPRNSSNRRARHDSTLAKPQPPVVVATAAHAVPREASVDPEEIMTLEEPARAAAATVSRNTPSATPASLGSRAGAETDRCDGDGTVDVGRASNSSDPILLARPKMMDGGREEVPHEEEVQQQQQAKRKQRHTVVFALEEQYNQQRSRFSGDRQARIARRERQRCLAHQHSYAAAAAAADGGGGGISSGEGGETGRQSGSSLRTPSTSMEFATATATAVSRTLSRSDSSSSAPSLQLGAPANPSVLSPLSAHAECREGAPESNPLLRNSSNDSIALLRGDGQSPASNFGAVTPLPTTDLGGGSLRSFSVGTEAVLSESSGAAAHNGGSVGNKIPVGGASLRAGPTQGSGSSSTTRDSTLQLPSTGPATSVASGSAATSLSLLQQAPVEIFEQYKDVANADEVNFSLQWLVFESPQNERLYCKKVAATRLFDTAALVVCGLNAWCLVAQLALSCTDTLQNRAIVAIQVVILLLLFATLVSASCGFRHYPPVVLALLLTFAIIAHFLTASCSITAVNYTGSLITFYLETTLLASQFLFSNRLSIRISFCIGIAALSTGGIAFRNLVFDDGVLPWDPLWFLGILGFSFVSFFTDYSMRKSFSYSRLLTLIRRRTENQYQETMTAALRIMLPPFAIERLLAQTNASAALAVVEDIAAPLTSASQRQQRSLFRRSKIDSSSSEEMEEGDYPDRRTTEMHAAADVVPGPSVGPGCGGDGAQLQLSSSEGLSDQTTGRSDGKHDLQHRRRSTAGEVILAALRHRMQPKFVTWEYESVGVLFVSFDMRGGVASEGERSPNAASTLTPKGAATSGAASPKLLATGPPRDDEQVQQQDVGSTIMPPPLAVLGCWGGKSDGGDDGLALPAAGGGGAVGATLGTVDPEPGWSPDLHLDMNETFIAIETILRRHGIHKIKSVAQTIMCVSGIEHHGHVPPSEVAQLTVALVRCGLDIRQYMSKERPWWEFRMGMHVGPCIGAVLGKRALMLDVFGNSVNVASRLASCAPPNSICASEDVKMRCNSHRSLSALIRPYGPMDIKGKGWMNVYQVI